MHGVQKIDLEKDLVSNAVAVERYTFDQANMSNVNRFPVVGVASVGCSERMVNRCS